MPGQRSYGRAHRKLRAEFAKIVDAGMAHCARCGGWIPPGQPWDLDHSDEDRTRYLGPSHVRCNRATSGRRKPRPARRWVL
jgi:hypothetical protein